MNVKKLDGGYVVDDSTVLVNFKDVAVHLANGFSETLELAESVVCPPCEKAHVEDLPQAAPEEVSQPAGAEVTPQV